MAITDTLLRMRRAFGASSMLMKIIWINIGVFVALRLTAIVGLFCGAPSLISTVLDFMQLPSSPARLATRPWALLSYMFTQYDLLHILFNMLWLYWFGSLLMNVVNKRQLLSLYIFGGLGGAALFILSYNTLPVFQFSSATLIGSSASVIAIVTATAILMPDFRMNLLFIGSVSLKWIAIATILLVLIGVTGSNAGGEIAHIGGVLAGAVFAMRLRHGRDITHLFDNVFNRISGMWNRLASTVWASFTKDSHRTAASSSKQSGDCSEPKTPASSAPRCDSDNDRETLDAILDKIKKSGYAGLTPLERKKLFDVSRKIK